MARMVDTKRRGKINAGRSVWSVASVIALLAGALLPTNATADTRKVDVIADQATFVDLFYAYNPADCRMKKILEVDWAQPKGGVLFLKYVPTTIEKGHCRGKTVQAEGIFYRSLPGFRGRDVGRVRFRYAGPDDSSFGRRTKSFKIIATVR